MWHIPPCRARMEAGGIPQVVNTTCPRQGDGNEGRKAALFPRWFWIWLKGNPWKSHGNPMEIPPCWRKGPTSFSLVYNCLGGFVLRTGHPQLLCQGLDACHMPPGHRVCFVGADARMEKDAVRHLTLDTF